MQASRPILRLTADTSFPLLPLPFLTSGSLSMYFSLSIRYLLSASSHCITTPAKPQRLSDLCPRLMAYSGEHMMKVEEACGSTCKPRV